MSGDDGCPAGCEGSEGAGAGRRVGIRRPDCAWQGTTAARRAIATASVKRLITVRVYATPPRRTLMRTSGDVMT